MSVGEGNSEAWEIMERVTKMRMRCVLSVIIFNNYRISGTVVRSGSIQREEQAEFSQAVVPTIPDAFNYGVRTPTMAASSEVHYEKLLY